MTYTYNEPDHADAFVDQNGDLHPDRDSAIYANIKLDLQQVMRLRFKPEDHPLRFFTLLEQLASRNPDLLAAYLENVPRAETF